MPRATGDVLDDIAETLVVGGLGVISEDVEDQLPSPTRLAGTDRWSTATAVADHYVDERGLDAEAVTLASGEETGLVGAWRPVAGALDGVPIGLIGYEEHPAGSKGLHMNFVFVTEVSADAEVTQPRFLLR